MRTEQSSQGFGLAVFGLLLLFSAFIVMLYTSNPVFSALLGLLSAILATAAFIEARRANGPKIFALVILLIAITGTLIILLKPVRSQIDEAIQEDGQDKEQVIKDQNAINEKLEELEKRLEMLEEEQ